MKKIFLLSLTISVSILFIACQKEAMPDKNALPESSILPLLENTINNPGKKPSDVVLNDLEEECQCYYEIISVDIEYFDEYPDAALEFLADENCPVPDSECRYFQGFHHTRPECNQSNSSCTDLWADLPPSGLFPFICTVPRYSSFNPRLFAPGVNELTCPGFGVLKSVIMVFKIH